MNFEKKIIFESSFEEVERLEGILNELQTNLQFDDEMYAKLMLVVSEAVTNGIMHGNKQDASKKVFMDVISNSKTLTFVIKDEGEGFEKQDIPNPLEEENLFNTSGRGVFLMEEYADKVDYSDNGTKLTLQFSI